MAIRAWMDGDLRLALRLLQWAQQNQAPSADRTGDKNLTFQTI